MSNLLKKTHKVTVGETHGNATVLDSEFWKSPIETFFKISPTSLLLIILNFLYQKSFDRPCGGLMGYGCCLEFSEADSLKSHVLL